ncbi:MAG: helix-turn-helix domain-containing protein [Actinoallomurus sp.]
MDLPLGGELGSRPVMLQLTRVRGRERDVVAMLATGTPSWEIAAGMFLPADTIGTHLRSAMREFDADSRTQAVAIPARLVEV